MVLTSCYGDQQEAGEEDALQTLPIVYPVN